MHAARAVGSGGLVLPPTPRLWVLTADGPSRLIALPTMALTPASRPSVTSHASAWEAILAIPSHSAPSSTAGRDSGSSSSAPAKEITTDGCASFQPSKMSRCNFGASVE